MKSPIKTEKLIELLADTKNITLLDVRRKGDYQAAPKKIPSASWQNPEAVDAWMGQVPDDKLIVTYCVKGGPVSQSVTDRLRQIGRNAVYLDGGIKAWVEKGQPLSEGPDKADNKLL